jgi:hypothetical protein
MVVAESGTNLERAATSLHQAFCAHSKQSFGIVEGCLHFLHPHGAGYKARLSYIFHFKLKNKQTKMNAMVTFSGKSPTFSVGRFMMAWIIRVQDNVSDPVPLGSVLICFLADPGSNIFSKIYKSSRIFIPKKGITLYYCREKLILLFYFLAVDGIVP